MSTPVSIPRLARDLLQTNKWMRNGRPVDSIAQTAMSQLANQAVRWRTKQVFSYSLPTDNIGTFASPGNRCRFAFRTSTHAHSLWAHAVVTIRDDGSSTTTSQSTLTIDDGTTTLGTAVFTFGGFSKDGSGVQLRGPSFFGAGIVPVSDAGAVAVATPDTDYYGVVADQSLGTLISIAVFERSLDPTIENGYLPVNFAAGAPIYDEDRGDLATVARNAWRRGAAPLFNWSVDEDATPRTRVSATSLNAVDGTSTTVSAATPGWTLDLRNRNRLSASTVACAFKVYAKMSAGSGVIRLKDSSGAAVSSITINSATAQWWSTTVNLPNTLAKYDLHLEGNGAGTCSLYAASLYQHVT